MSEKTKYDKSKYPIKDKRLTCSTCGQKYYSGKWFVTHMRWHETHPGMIWVPANGRAKKAKPTVVGNLANISLGTAPPCITLSSGAVVVEPSVGVLKSVSHMEEDRSAMAKKDSCRMQNLCIACNKQFDVSYKMKYCPDCGATLKTISYVKVVLK